MSNTFNQRQRASRKGARLAWLLGSDLMHMLPGAADDVSPEQSTALELARTRMVLAGLYSPTSERRATRWGIRLLISELRKQHVGGKDQRYKS